MSAQDLEQRARELLGQPYHEEISGLVKGAPLFEGQEEWVPFDEALRAIVTALCQQPAPVDLEQFRFPGEAWKSHLDPNDDDESEAYDEADRLLSIIDNAGEVERAEPEFVDWLAKEMPAGTVIGDPAGLGQGPAGGGRRAHEHEVRQVNSITERLAAALRDCYILAYNCHRDELPGAIITTASKAIAEFTDGHTGVLTQPTWITSKLTAEFMRASKW